MRLKLDATVSKSKAFISYSITVVFGFLVGDGFKDDVSGSIRVLVAVLVAFFDFLVLREVTEALVDALRKRNASASRILLPG